MRVNDNSLSHYMKQNYNLDAAVSIEEHTIGGITPFLQKDFGAANDCTLMSIATALYARGIGSIQEIYNVVEKVATKYFYHGNFGTIGLFNRRIYQESCDILGVDYSPSYRMLKGWFFSADTICEALRQNKPVVLSMYRDGREYYDAHTVLAIGYKRWADGTVMLQVYDNWVKTIAYVDYQKIGLITSISW